ncbi:MAG TPA: hypothetical protein VFR58_11305 [Flavisolibacter sp.]|nr:hypothetical protein [Flavisolibacter sp.]
MKKKHIFWIGVGAALAAVAAILLINKSKEETSDKPPKKAPQVPVDNPGDQSDFPKAARESDLG